MLKNPLQIPGLDSKNSDKCKCKYFPLDTDISIDLLDIQESEEILCKGQFDKRLIQFYFCLSGKMVFSFFGGRYKQVLRQGSSFMFYNPQMDLPQVLTLSEKPRVLCLYITVKKLHELFVHDLSELSFLDGENINKKCYAERPIHPGLQLVLDQIFHNQTLPSNKRVYFLGKMLELLSLYFSAGSEQAEENCPFLLDENNVKKIHLAKKVLIQDIVNPPAIKQLARETGLNEHQLKVGFKNLYGKTIFQYLTDYKMEHARHLLENRSYQVSEVCYMIGYSNPSHFIAAFKRKYGITPKKYLMSLQKTTA